MIGCDPMLFSLGCGAISLLVCLPLSLYYEKRDRILGACFRLLGTVCALVPALISAVKLQDISWFCAFAILFFAAGDFLMLFRSDLGATCYGIAVPLLLVYVWKLVPVGITHLLLILMFAALSAFLFFRFRKEIQKRLIPLLIYDGLLCLLCGSALAGGMSLFSVSGWSLAAGGIGMFLSQVFLFLYAFTKAGSPFAVLQRATFYVALLCFGLSGLIG